MRILRLLIKLSLFLFLAKGWASSFDSNSFFKLAGTSVKTSFQAKKLNQLFPVSIKGLGKRNIKVVKSQTTYEYPGHLRVSFDSKKQLLSSLKIESEKGVDYVVKALGSQFSVLQKGWKSNDLKLVMGAPHFNFSQSYYYYNYFSEAIKLTISYGDMFSPKKKIIGVSWQHLSGDFLQSEKKRVSEAQVVAKKDNDRVRQNKVFKKSYDKKKGRRANQKSFSKKSSMINREFSHACHSAILECGSQPLYTSCKPSPCNYSKAEKKLWGALLVGRKAAGGDRYAQNNLYEIQRYYIQSYTSKSTKQTVGYYVVHTYAFYKDAISFGQAIAKTDPKNVTGYGPQFERLGSAIRGKGYAAEAEASRPSYSEHLKQRMNQLGNSVDNTFNKASDWKARGYNKNQVDQENARRALQRNGR